MAFALSTTLDNGTQVVSCCDDKGEYVTHALVHSNREVTISTEALPFEVRSVSLDQSSCEAHCNAVYAHAKDWLFEWDYVEPAIGRFKLEMTGRFRPSWWVQLPEDPDGYLPAIDIYGATGFEAERELMESFKLEDLYVAENRNGAKVSVLPTFEDVCMRAVVLDPQFGYVERSMIQFGSAAAKA